MDVFMSPASVIDQAATARIAALQEELQRYRADVAHVLGVDEEQALCK
jgi:hypothetical protein